MNIALSGKLRAGKDTAALYLQNKLSDRNRLAPKIRCFAGQLKAFCRALESGTGPFRVAYEFLIECERNGLRVGPIYPLARQLAELTETYAGQAVAGKNRQLLQTVAELCCAQIDPNIWIDTVLAQHKGECDRYDSIIPDCRKTYEADALRALGFRLIRIDVDPDVQRARVVDAGGLWSPEIIDFPTETWLDDYEHFDVRIVNNGTLETFYAQLDTFIANELNSLPISARA